MFGGVINSLIKDGLEQSGPKVVGAPISVGDVSFSALSGKGEIKQLTVGNPPGFNAPHALHIPRLLAAAKSSSVMSDKVIVKSLQADAVQIHVEGGHARTNVGAILANVNDYSGSRSNSRDKRLQIDELVIADPRVELSLTGLKGRAFPFRLSNLRLAGLGQTGDGVTADALAMQVFSEVMRAIRQQALPHLDALKKDVLTEAKSMDSTARDQLHAAAEGLKAFIEKP